MQTKNKKRIIVFSVLLAFLITASIFKIASKEDVPTISVDYGKIIDELTKPEIYDPCDNAALLINKALQNYNYGRIPLKINYNSMLIRTDQIIPKRLKEIKKWLDSNEVTLSLAAQASKKPYYWKEIHIEWYNYDPGLFDTYSVNFSDLYPITYSLIWRARLHEKNEETEKAISDLIIAYKVANFTSNEVQGLHMGISETKENVYKNLADIICQNKISSDILLKTQRAIESLVLRDLALNIEVSRLITLNMIQRTFTDDGNGDGHLIIRSFSDFQKSLNGGMTRSPGNLSNLIRDIPDYNAENKRIEKLVDSRIITTVKLNKTYDLAQSIYKQTPYKILKDKGNSYRTIIEQIAQNNFLVFDQDVNRDHIYKNYHESLCQHQALISILAINRYKADKGRLPATLEKLMEEGYIKNIPMDPYSDKPLIYKLTKKGFILYSIGRNFTDDGGEYTEFETWRGTRKNGDYIFWPVFPKENETPENTEMDPYFTDPDYDPNNPIY